MTRAAALRWASHILGARRRGARTEEEALVSLLIDLYRDVDAFSIDVMGAADLRAYLTTLKERS